MGAEMMRYSLRLVSAFAMALILGSFIGLDLGMVSGLDPRPNQGANEQQYLPDSETDYEGIRPLCAWRTRDVCAPLVEMTLPNGGEVFRGTEPISWLAIAFNGEPLNQDLYYSADSGEEWIVIATGLRETSFNWDTTNVPDGSNYLIRVVVHGDVTGGRDQSDRVFSVDNIGGTASPSSTIDPVLIYVISGFLGLFIVLAVIALKRR
jgi:hypothetical protein